MDRKEIFRQILIKLMENGLLNDFISIVFNYDLEQNDFIYAQYKLINKEIVLEIFDNNKKNRFNAYVFVENSKDKFIENKSDENTAITYLYLDNCYKKYKENKNVSNLIKLASAFRVKSDKEFKELIQGVFNKDIEKIIYDEIKRTSL